MSLYNNGKNEIKVDMHIHTTASDGTWSPEKLIEKVKEKNIGLFSVTDHNSIDNVEKTSILARANNIYFIPGVEIDVTLEGKRYHILGYGIDIYNKELSELLNKNKALLNKNDDDSIRVLQSKFSSISLFDYENYSNNCERGGWKSLNYLIDKGICTNHKEYFEMLREVEDLCDKAVFVSPSEAIETIIKAGGVPILAHPGVSFYQGNLEDIIRIMIEQGIKGIECFHPDNSIEVTNYCLEVCNSKQLLITGGSDCHGDFTKLREIGIPNITIGELKLEGLLTK